MKIKPIHLILLFALIIRLIFAFGWHEIWWDSGVYIGMGKDIYSAGENGLWEHIRPPLMPIILGAIWKTGLDPILWGRIIEIIMMLGIIWLTYKLTTQWWNEKTAIIASLIITLSPIFYYLSFHQYTEIPSTLLALLSLYLLTKEKYIYSGLAIGLAFLAKFPTGIYLPIILLYLLLNKKWKPALQTTTGFAIITAPYFIWSLITYGSITATMLAAQDAINRALGCNVLRHQEWWQYFWWLFNSETKLHILAIPGIWMIWKHWKKQHTLYALSLVIPLIYFMQLNCRDYRYLTLFLPFIAMLTANGIMLIYETIFTNSIFSPKTKKEKKITINEDKKNNLFKILTILLTLWMLSTCLTYYYGNEQQRPDTTAEQYHTYLTNKQINGEIWISNPITAAHTNQRLHKIYYPVYDEKLSIDFTQYLKENKNKIGAVLLDNCGGGIICPPTDQHCEQQTQELITELDKDFTRTLDLQKGRCWYRVWE